MWKDLLLLSLFLLGWMTAVNGKSLIFQSEQDAVVEKPTNVQEFSPNLACPDPKYSCQGNDTCCKGRPPNEFACCPYPMGVCCPDGIHCCPRGSHCDMVHQRCYRQGEFRNEILEAKSMNPSGLAIERATGVESKSVICPGGGAQCLDGNTCCRTNSGEYGCCPVPQAVCCSDGEHCCPHGYTCNVGTGTCAKGDDRLPFLQKLPAKVLSIVREESSVICPGGQYECPSGNTCCKLHSGGYGCCPIPKAVCCSDGVHCCPNGFRCSTGTCMKGNHIIPFLVKSVAINVQDVVCPGGGFTCPSGNTCCKLASGSWGCCPLPRAVCCSDGEHCCPESYKCDVSAGTCLRGNDVIPFYQKSWSVNHVCPGGESTCPDGNTCCKLASGSWGCCPLPKAVCCSDGEHCCPNGYTCDVSSGACMRGDEAIPFYKKSPSVKVVSARVSVKNVVCPGGISYCPDGNTCCKLSSGQFGCCPIPTAVCCSDGEHCCPTGYRCDVSAGTCVRGDHTIPFYKKSATVSEIVKDVVCPGGGSTCPDGNTCCKLASGSWGCCPLPKAVCCSDGEHCCPSGYTCRVTTGACVKGDHIIPYYNKSPALNLVSKSLKAARHRSEHNTCEDKRDTACKLASGDYGCCPLHKAVCCADGVHCCPEGCVCDEKAGKCANCTQHFPSPKKAVKLMSRKVESVVCPDNQSECPDGYTCCLDPSGTYGCCSLSKAVCCSDKLHCCPNGYTCDLKDSKCTKGSDVLPLFVKHAARSRVEKEYSDED